MTTHHAPTRVGPTPTCLPGSALAPSFPVAPCPTPQGSPSQTSPSRLRRPTPSHLLAMSLHTDNPTHARCCPPRTTSHAPTARSRPTSTRLPWPAPPCASRLYPTPQVIPTHAGPDFPGHYLPTHSDVPSHRCVSPAHADYPSPHVAEPNLPDCPCHRRPVPRQSSPGPTSRPEPSRPGSAAAPPTPRPARQPAPNHRSAPLAGPDYLPQPCSGLLAPDNPTRPHVCPTQNPTSLPAPAPLRAALSASDCPCRPGATPVNPLLLRLPEPAHVPPWPISDKSNQPDPGHVAPVRLRLPVPSPLCPIPSDFPALAPSMQPHPSRLTEEIK